VVIYAGSSNNFKERHFFSVIGVKRHESVTMQKEEQEETEETEVLLNRQPRSEPPIEVTVW
jgi:hypothetical protein